MIVLAELTPLDPVLGTRQTLRCTNANDRRVTGLNSLTWYPAISSPPTIAIRLFKGDFDGTISPNGGAMVLQIDKFLTALPNARRFVWQGAKIKLWAGDKGQVWPWTQIYEGIVDGDSYSASGNQVRLNIRSDSTPFEKDALTLKYAGTGGIEGGTALANQPKPFLLGRCSNVEPVLIDSVNNIYQFSAYGPIQAVNALYEKASQFGASVGNFANYTALVAALVPNGEWATCLASGLIKLGAPAAGVITGDVDGDAFGGTWTRKTGEIVQRIASNAGVSGSLIDTTSWNALDTALAGLSNQGRIGYFLNAQKTVLEVAAELAAPCNAQAGVSFMGKLFACRISVGAGSLVLDAQQKQLPRVVSSEETGLSPPFSYIEFAYDRAWKVHSTEEISGFDQLISVRYPDPPPATMLIGGIYIGQNNEQYRFVGTNVFSDEGDITSDEGAVTSSGYEDIQDLAISTAQATADAALLEVTTLEARVNAIDDDDIITISEKVEVLIPAAAAFAAAYSAISANATAAGVSVSTLNTKRTAWLDFLAAISPAWNNISVASPVVRGSLDTARSEYDTELKSVQRLAIEAMTAATQVTASMSPDKTVPADYLGVVTSTNLALVTWTPTVVRGGVSIRGADDVHYTITGDYGGTFTRVDTDGASDKGTVSITAITALDAGGVLNITVAGIAVAALPFKVSKALAPAPSAPSGTDSKSWAAGEFITLNSTSYVEISSVKTLALASGQSLYGTAPLDYYVTGNGGVIRTMTAKWQYAVAGSGSWNDFAAGIVGSSGISAIYTGPPDYEVYDAEPGSVAVTQTKSGLPAGSYDVRLVGLLNATGRNVNPTGTALMEAKP